MQISHPFLGIFKKTLLSYLLILFLPLIIGSLLYRNSIRIVEKQAVELSMTTQANAIQYLDNYLQEMENLSHQFYIDSQISALQNVKAGQLDTLDMSTLLSAKKSKDHYYINEDFRNRYFLFFTQSNIILSQDWLTARPDLFYKECANYTQIDYPDWVQMMNEISANGIIPMQEISTINNPIQAFTYLIPIRFHEDSYAILSVLFEESLLHKIFGLEEPSSPYVCMFDSQGQLIYNNSHYDLAKLPEFGDISGENGYFSTNIDGEPVLVVHSASPYNGWTYLSIFSSNTLLRPVRQIQNLTVIIFITTLLIGLVGSLFLAKRVSDPVRSVLALLQDHTQKDKTHQDEMAMIQSAVGSLIHSNKQIEGNLKEQNRVLNALFIDRILSGATNFTSEDIQNFNEDLKKLHNTALTLTVLVLECDPVSTEEMDALACVRAIDMLCDKIVETTVPAFYCSHLYRNNQLVLLLGDTHPNHDLPASTEQFIQQLFSVLPPSLSNCVWVGIGNPCSCIADICGGYNGANEAIYYLRKNQLPQRYFWYKNIPNTSNTFFYTVDEEKKLINTIKSGMVDDVQNLCDSLYIENFVDNQITHTMKICFLFNLYCTAIKVEMPEQLLSNEARLEFSNLTQRYAQNTDEIFSVLSQRILSLAASYQNVKQSAAPQISEQFKKYIEQHYMDADLDTGKIAQEFHFSEGYFSHLFKEQCGETFSEYLEQYRISKACKLLTDPKPTVSSVSELVGYANVYTFRRAFKRVLGILPTQYREQL